MKKCYGLTLIILFLLFPFTKVNVYAQNFEPKATLININKMAMWVHSDGTTAQDPHGNASIFWGLVYPRGLPVGTTFADGLVWGGAVKDSQTPEIRVGGNTYTSGLQPGAILSPGNAEVAEEAHVNKIWRYRRDWQTVNLTNEAFDILASQPGAKDRNFEFSEAELQHISDSLRVAYEKDLNDWPWQKGSPFYDINGNGLMDIGEEPGLLSADQVVWLVTNDLDTAAVRSLYGSPSIGLELQLTVWAYKDIEFLDNIIFKRYKLIYKGTNLTSESAFIDSMYISQWADPDLGTFTDDFVGCDTTLDLGYVYNSTSHDEAYRAFGLFPPAVGYRLLQGPIATSPGSVATFNFKQLTDYENLRMTTFSGFSAGGSDTDPTRGGNYNGTIQWWNMLRGYRPRPESPPTPWINPLTNKITKFIVTGDPVTGTGWLHSNPGDPRLYWASGPFKLALGDTQEVIIAVVGGLGSNRLASISVMKHFVKLAQFFVSGNFDVSFFREEEAQEPSIPDNFQLHQNFPNPFNPTTEIRYDLPVQRLVTLSIYNTLGQQVIKLVDEIQEPASYVLTWDGTNSKGEILATGVYYYKIDLGRFSTTKKMLLLR